MKFNPTEKAESLVGDIDFLLFGSSATLNTDYSIEDRTRNTNSRYDEAVSIFFRADPNWKWDDSGRGNLPIATTNLVANQDNYGFDDSMIMVHRVRIKNEQGDFVTLEPVEDRELTDSQLDDTGMAKYYSKIGNAVLPIPVPTHSASGGVEVTFQRGGVYFVKADTDKEPGFSSLYHRYLSIGASLDYALANGMTEKINVLSAMLVNMREAMEQHYSRRSPDEKPKLSLKTKSIKHYGL